jgi:5'-3' exonuclease
MITFIVDGDNLLNIGYYGRKNYFYDGKHIGGLYHFLVTLKTFIETNEINKICVFWDGEDGNYERRKIYPQYKLKPKVEIDNDNYNYQKIRTKQYLEELFIIQAEFFHCESDDLISYYVKNTAKEEKIIISSDRDMLILLDEKTKVYNPRTHILYDINSEFIYEKQTVNINNVKLIKILCGDNSDNILGVKGLGIKRLLEIVPEIKTEIIDLKFVFDRCNNLKKPKNIIKNILDGTTKNGNFGKRLFDLNEEIIGLDKLFLNDEVKSEINDLINNNLDSEDRSYKNIIKMMLEDGLSTLLPKNEDAWINFFLPFLNLIRIEKNKNYQKT